jgi:hypothetical protein
MHYGNAPTAAKHYVRAGISKQKKVSFSFQVAILCALCLIQWYLSILKTRSLRGRTSSYVQEWIFMWTMGGKMCIRLKVGKSVYDKWCGCCVFVTGWLQYISTNFYFVFLYMINGVGVVFLRQDGFSILARILIYFNGRIGFKAIL